MAVGGTPPLPAAVETGESWIRRLPGHASGWPGSNPRIPTRNSSACSGWAGRGLPSELRPYVEADPRQAKRGRRLVATPATGKRRVRHGGDALRPQRRSVVFSPRIRGYLRGVDYLLPHPVRRWFLAGGVRDLAAPAPFRQSGFPGRDQWTSAAGTSWATICPSEPFSSRPCPREFCLHAGSDESSTARIPRVPHASSLAGGSAHLDEAVFKREICHLPKIVRCPATGRDGEGRIELGDCDGVAEGRGQSGEDRSVIPGNPEASP